MATLLHLSGFVVVGVGVFEHALGVVEVGGSSLAGVQMWWWDPFGAPVFAADGAPAAVFDRAVMLIRNVK